MSAVGYADARSRIRVEQRVRRLARLARLLDAEYGIPGTRIRFGIDGLLGLAPGIGDAAGLVLSAYIVIEGWRLAMPGSMIARMIANIAIDAVLGAIPVAGDLFDIAFKANLRNLALVQRHVRRSAG
jgi:Domain of unknown function (DUF4112)